MSENADEATDELYGVEPSQFVAQRTSLAKELTKAGDKEGAAKVKALRKPTAAAWAVNQLSRRHTKTLEELLDLGERLRAAQRRALSGRGAEELRDLSAERRKAVDALARQAVAALGAGGETQRDAITTTLEAALASARAAELVRAGRLVKELPAPSGFGDDDLDDGDGDDDGERRGEQPDHDSQADADAAEPDAEAEAREEQARAAVAVKRDALEAAAEKAEDAARDADAARAEVERLRDELAQARARADDLADRARDAQSALKRAQKELDEAERSLGGS